MTRGCAVVSRRASIKQGISYSSKMPRRLFSYASMAFVTMAIWRKRRPSSRTRRRILPAVKRISSCREGQATTCTLSASGALRKKLWKYSCSRLRRASVSARKFFSRRVGGTGASCNSSARASSFFFVRYGS